MGFAVVIIQRALTAMASLTAERRSMHVVFAAATAIRALIASGL